MKAELFFIREEKLNVEKVFTRRDATNFQSVKVIFKLKLLWNEKLRNLTNPIFNALLFQKMKKKSNPF